MKQKKWIAVAVLAVCVLVILAVLLSRNENESVPATTGEVPVIPTVAQTESETGKDETADTKSAGTENIATEPATTEIMATEPATTEATAALIEDGGDVEIIIPEGQEGGGF